VTHWRQETATTTSTERAYNSAKNKIDMFASSTVIQTTNYNPDCTSPCTDQWGKPYLEQYSNENVNDCSDLPGTSTQKASYTSMAYLANKWNGSGTPSFSNIADGPVAVPANPNETWYKGEAGGNSSSMNAWTYGHC
jgi:hypothetical protein